MRTQNERSSETYSTDIYGKMSIVKQVKINKLRDLDSNYTGIKHMEKQEELGKVIKKKILKKDESEISYESKKPLVPFLAFLEQTGASGVSS